MFTSAANAVADKKAVSNPGLEALWEDERRYRAAKGLDSRDLDAQLAHRAAAAPVASNDSIAFSLEPLLFLSKCSTLS